MTFEYVKKEIKKDNNKSQLSVIRVKESSPSDTQFMLGRNCIKHHEVTFNCNECKKYMLFNNEQINSGSFGTIFKGKICDVYHTTKKCVTTDIIIKKIPARLFKEDEINALLEFNEPDCEPNILCLKYYFTHTTAGQNTYTYMIVENLTNSMTLYDYINKIKYDTLTLLNIMKNIIEAFVKIHNKNIVHMDIQTNNIMICPKTLNIKIIDFGKACSTKDTGKIKKCKLDIGTLEFTDPELPKFYRNIAHTDMRLSDIYSLGIVFYILANKKMPQLPSNVGVNQVKYLNDIASGPPIVSEYEGCDDINIIINRMLSFERVLRPNINELYEIISCIKNRLIESSQIVNNTQKSLKKPKSYLDPFEGLIEPAENKELYYKYKKYKSKYIKLKELNKI